jgi:hypothetical protein
MILETLDGRQRNEFIWLRIGTSRGAFFRRAGAFVFHKKGTVLD